MNIVGKIWKKKHLKQLYCLTSLRVRTVAKRREIFYAYCIFYSGFMCQTTVFLE